MQAQEKSISTRIAFAHMIKEAAGWLRTGQIKSTTAAQTGVSHAQALQGPLPFQEHGCEMEII